MERVSMYMRAPEVSDGLAGKVSLLKCPFGTPAFASPAEVLSLMLSVSVLLGIVSENLGLW